MTKELQELMSRAGKVEMTSEQREIQRQSFAYGNTNIENERITREMIKLQAKKLVNVGK